MKWFKNIIPPASRPIRANVKQTFVVEHLTHEPLKKFNNQHDAEKFKKKMEDAGAYQPRDLRIRKIRKSGRKW